MYLLGNAFLMMEKEMSDLSRTVEAGLIYTDRVIRDRCADSVSTYVNSMKQLADALLEHIIDGVIVPEQFLIYIVSSLY